MMMIFRPTGSNDIKNKDILIPCDKDANKGGNFDGRNFRMSEFSDSANRGTLEIHIAWCIIHCSFDCVAMPTTGSTFKGNNQSVSYTYSSVSLYGALNTQLIIRNHSSSRS